MKIIQGIVFLLFSIPFFLQGQVKSYDELMVLGSELQSREKYTESIVWFKSAMVLNKDSSDPLYEIAYSYYNMKDFKKTIRYCRKALRKEPSSPVEIYILLGSAIDARGKTSKAISVYKKALEKYPHDYLLHYNLALSFYNNEQLQLAEETLIDALVHEPSHNSSHLLLTFVMYEQEQRVKSLLPLYYFLLIEPDSDRSRDAYELLQEIIYSGSSDNIINEDGTIDLEVNPGEEEFGAAGIMLGMLSASRALEMDAGKSNLQVFTENTRALFSFLGELSRDNSGFWWDFYVDFFYSIVESGNTKAYTYFISQASDDPEVTKWFKSHSTELDRFADWLENR
ncbi:MAG: tetratricopeptide repeat protein [Bacteroidota bacterium]